MNEATENRKKLFLISVTDKENTLNRKFQEVILDLFNTVGPFNKEYDIEPHNHLYNENLYESIDEALRDHKYEGYIIVLDCLDRSKGLCNPNVMFEFGAVKYLEKPFVVIAANSNEEYPFDVRNLNIETIPESVLEYTRSCYANKEKSKIAKSLYDYFAGEEAQKNVTQFLDAAYSKYKESFKAKVLQNKNVDKNVDNKEILDEIQEIKKLLNNTAQYIEGEEAAFTALRESVNSAKYSLRTTRFANQTIVADDSLNAQIEFMDSLYEASVYLKDNFTRIICNNHPLKWKDIFNILFYGGNGSKIYIRKNDFSIHFELVIIDEKTAFIHFYQNNSNKRNENSEITNSTVEKINSTLKIEGKSICKKLANIFDRLHHRDFRETVLKDPSRTLLGMPISNENWMEEYKENGCFVLDDSFPIYKEYNQNTKRRKLIIHMFKEAFRTWKFDDNHPENEKAVNRDKINMVVGIALIESECEFINDMKGEKLSQTEYDEAIKLFRELN